jgi:hypothetical protein
VHCRGLRGQKLSSELAARAGARAPSGAACRAKAASRAALRPVKHKILIKHDGARRCWSALKGGLSADEIAAAHDVLLERMDAEFETLKRLEAVSSAAEATFAGAPSARDMDPAATGDARAAETEAAENAQARARAKHLLSCAIFQGTSC